MKRSQSRWARGSGVLWTASLAATLLAGSACTVEVEDADDPFYESYEGDVAETDDMLHGEPSDDVAAPADEGRETVHDVDDFGADEEQPATFAFPLCATCEPEPDPWHQPMNGSDQSGKD